MPYSFDPDAAGLIPEGVHVLTVTAVDETTARSDGLPMWIVRLEDAQGREITEWIKHTDRIIDWKFRPLWQAAGLTWPTGRATIDERELIDRQVQATVKHERSEQYGTSARIDGYVRPGTNDLNPNGQPALQTTPADDDLPF